ncbi:MAG: type II methionyl aminopeptidase [Methanobacteriota archaeon]|nr:MAG: type II methionyl aminopeptidase [Euryarchaeota archaeon]
MDESVRQKLRLAGKVAAEARTLGVSLCKEGASLLDIAERIERHMRSHGAPPAFPTCLSIDHIAAHYSPVHDDRLTLKRGNVVKLDLGAQVDGYIADTAVSVEIATRNWTELIKASEQALETAIEVCRPKTPTRLIGAAIERAIESYGFKPISNLTGHTIERYNLHAGKSVPNVGGVGDEVVESGDTLAIEPFSTNGAGKVEGRKSGNIYRLLSTREIAPQPLNDFLHQVHEHFKTLPFSERWAYALDAKAPAHLGRLLRAGRIMTYESLVDVGRGIVAQTEHTMIVDGGGVEVTTR